MTLKATTVNVDKKLVLRLLEVNLPGELVVALASSLGETDEQITQRLKERTDTEMRNLGWTQ